MFNHQKVNFTGKFINMGLLVIVLLFFCQAVNGKSVNHALEEIIIDKVDFNEANFLEVIKYLREKSKGRVNFFVNLPDGKKSIPVTLQLSNVSVCDVVRYACMVTGVKYKITDTAVVIGGGLDRISGPELPGDIYAPGNKTFMFTPAKTLSLEFEDASIDTVIEYLRVSSRTYTLERGINIVSLIREEEKKELPHLTLAVNNISVGDAVKHVCSAANLDFRVEHNTVVIFPKQKEKK